jgi:transcriptional regulator with XRE-family HTH domain
MLLKDWLDKNKDKISRKDFADAIGVEQGTISRYIHGQRTPELAVAVKIVAETKGKVRLEDLLNVEPTDVREA